MKNMINKLTNIRTFFSTYKNEHSFTSRNNSVSGKMVDFRPVFNQKQAIIIDQFTLLHTKSRNVYT